MLGISMNKQINKLIEKIKDTYWKFENNHRYMYRSK